MRCEDVGCPDQRGVVVTPSEQAFLVLEENVWREHARVHARPVLCPLAFIVEVCTWMPRVIAFSTQSHTALWRHQHRSHRTVVVRSPRTAAHSVLQTHVCINCVSTRAHPCSGSVVLTTNGADSACVRSAAACGRGSSSDWPLTGLRPRPTRSRRTRRPPPGTQHARPSSHRARRQLDVRPRPCAGPARPARGPCKEARTTQRTRFLCRGLLCRGVKWTRGVRRRRGPGGGTDPGACTKPNPPTMRPQSPCCPCAIPGVAQHRCPDPGRRGRAGGRVLVHPGGMV